MSNYQEHLVMKNESGLKPLGHAVLCLPYEPEIDRAKRGGIIVPPQARERNTMLESRVIVIEVGPDAWSDEEHPRAKPGDKVLVTRMAGYMAEGTTDKVMYRLVNDRDIFCKIGVEK
jgi:co-chaperonin GroES (HSP10)